MQVAKDKGKVAEIRSAGKSREREKETAEGAKCNSPGEREQEAGEEAKNLKERREKELKLGTRNPESSRRARPEAVLVKPAEGVSYATILRSLKSRVNPKELGIRAQGTRATGSKDLLVEMRCDLVLTTQEK